MSAEQEIRQAENKNHKTNTCHTGKEAAFFSLRGSVQIVLHGCLEEIAMENKDLQGKRSFSSILKKGTQTTQMSGATSLRED